MRMEKRNYRTSNEPERERGWDYGRKRGWCDGENQIEVENRHQK